MEPSNGTEKTYNSGFPWRVTPLTNTKLILENGKGVVLPVAYTKM